MFNASDQSPSPPAASDNPRVTDTTNRGRPSDIQRQVKHVVKACLPRLFRDLIFAIDAHRRALGEFPRILRPRTFNERILRRKVFDRRPLLSTFADKFGVRQFVADKVGSDILPQLHHVTTDPVSIDFEGLPQRFVVKASHGSGWVRVVWDKSAVDRQELVQTCNRWLATNYYNVLRERAYRTVPPRILIEEFIDDGSGGSPNDYKFYVFGGKVALIEVHGDRFADHRRSFYDTSWQDTGLKLKNERFSNVLPRPANLDAMMRIAQKLAEDIEFVRVDLYDTGRRVYFGEMTATPVCGLACFEPRAMDRQLGDLWESSRLGGQSRQP
jgi:hypothetical protein